MKLEKIKGSENYVAQIIKLPPMIPVKNLDNLVKVSYQGNSCLVGKDSDVNEEYIFFSAETELSDDFCSCNNLYRHKELNVDKTQSGYIEDSRRVKSIKFKGVISTGFICPISFLSYLEDYKYSPLKVGDEFTDINGINICKKYITKRQPGKEGARERDSKLLDSIIDGKMAPEHMDTSHLMKNIHKLSLNDYIAVTYKLHGTSARCYHALTKVKSGVMSRVAEFLGVKTQKEEYSYVVGSRKVIKSRNFEPLNGKNHYYSEDLWTKISKEQFEGKLIHGEAVYFEIIGKTYDGGEIQGGYSYGFDKPKCYIYRISNINSKGVEIDLSYLQMKERALQLGVEVCPEFWFGKLGDFITQFHGKEVSDNRDVEPFLENVFYNMLLEQPSILDSSVVEEGFCIRIDKYPKPEIFKIKSKQFLLSESKQLDKPESVNLEDEQ